MLGHEDGAMLGRIFAVEFLLQPAMDNGSNAARYE